MINRSRSVGVRFTESEYDQICEQAKKDKSIHYKNGELNLSGYIRKKVLQENNNQSPQKSKSDIKNLLYQFRKIGVNVNQATKKINSGYGTIKATEEMKEELHNLNNLFAIFLEMMEEKDSGSN